MSLQLHGLVPPTAHCPHQRTLVPAAADDVPAVGANVEGADIGAMPNQERFRVIVDVAGGLADVDDLVFAARHDETLWVGVRGWHYGEGVDKFAGVRRLDGAAVRRWRVGCELPLADRGVARAGDDGARRREDNIADLALLAGPAAIRGAMGTYIGFVAAQGSREAELAHGGGARGRVMRLSIAAVRRAAAEQEQNASVRPRHDRADVVGTQEWEVVCGVK